MGQRVLNQGVMNAPVGIGDVKPGNCQRTFTPLSCLDYGCQLHLMLCDTRDGGQKSLLQVRVKVLVGTHVSQPSLLQDS